MMYQYTKSPVAPDRLTLEIRNSSIIISLDYITTEGSAVKIYFKSSISSEEETTLAGIVSSHTGVPLPENTSIKIDSPKTTSGFAKVSIYEPEGVGATIVSHNYADKSSWYQGSVQIISGAMTNAGLVYSDPNGKTDWIDLENGRVYDEDNVMIQSSNKYKVRVYVDSVEVTTGFTVDYVAGTITFSQTPTGVVTASYCYADTSYFSLRPKVGKVLSIKAAEVQFSAGTTLNGPFVFSPWFVDHPIYGTMEIPGQQIYYKNAKDFISACNEGQGLIPKWGELTTDVHVFPFNYARPKPVKYTDYIEIRVYCKTHNPVGGEFATATFYVTIDDILVG